MEIYRNIFQYRWLESFQRRGRHARDNGVPEASMHSLINAGCTCPTSLPRHHCRVTLSFAKRLSMSIDIFTYQISNRCFDEKETPTDSDNPERRLSEDGWGHNE